MKVTPLGMPARKKGGNASSMPLARPAATGGDGAVPPIPRQSGKRPSSATLQIESMTESSRKVHTPRFTTEAVRKLIAGALPKRELAVGRDALISSIVERIETWKAIKPQIKPHAKKIRQLVTIAKKLDKAIEAAGNELRKFRADQELRDVYIYRAALTSINPNVNRNDYAQDSQNAIDRVRTALDSGTQPEPVPLSGHSALLDLYVLQQSIVSLWIERSTRWNKFWRPGEGRPRDFDVSLTAQLQWLCCKAAGCSAKEFSDFLQPLNDSVEWQQAGLPKLVSATLVKRAERERKKRKTN